MAGAAAVSNRARDDAVSAGPGLMLLARNSSRGSGTTLVRLRTSCAALQAV